ncbi:MAG: Rieske 2Fe-2S domain-containing protein [Candidatus Aenigmarchaeota archaeon]|nr:Rieske 2Fe-2S domain-containing protein [Candidatus Aenigmarchaeota archaeon]
MGFVEVAKVSDVKPGNSKVVSAAGKELALFNVDGTFFVTENACLHRGGPLGEGELDDGIVTCPWHGWKFNVKTGVSPVNPAAKVQTHKVKVEGDKVLVEV